MKLSPLDIKRQQFTKAFRGYDADEVDAFVKQIALQWEAGQDELRLANERNRELEQKLKHYERVELALQEALETARETARRSEEAAERKAKIIVEQAELKAERTLQDAEQERFGLRRDLAKLTGRQNEVAARLRAFLMSELEILAQFQGDDPVGFIRLESGSTASGQLEAHTAPALDPAQESDLADLTDDLGDAQGLDAASSMPEEATDAASTDVPDTAPMEADIHQAAETFTGDDRSTDELVTDERVPDAPAASEPAELAAEDGIDWDLPETVEPDPQAGGDSDWNLRTLVTGESDSVAGSEAERERIRRILEDLD